MRRDYNEGDRASSRNIEGAIEFLGDDFEPSLVVRREPALDARPDDQGGAVADRTHAHRLRVHREELFELDATREEDEIGEIVGRAPGRGGGDDGSELDASLERR